MNIEGKKILVTAGPTYEAIDPVRFIGNHSSGKMGYSIVETLVARGADVTLISGPTNLPSPEGANTIRVTSAKEMYDTVATIIDHTDAYILAAAVADYTPTVVVDKKIKKQGDTLTIELKKTLDIAQEVGKIKKPTQVAVGFALETDNEEVNAQNKLERKKFDFIVLNSLQNKDTCFGSNFNKIIIIEKDKKIEYDFKPKQEVANDIVNHLITKLN